MLIFLKCWETSKPGDKTDNKIYHKLGSEVTTEEVATVHRNGKYGNARDSDLINWLDEKLRQILGKMKYCSGRI